MIVDNLSTERVGVLQGGGLSSLALGIWLREQGIHAHHYVADIGQSSPPELSELTRTLGLLGLPATVVDLRAEMAALGLDLVRYQARHDGGYWNTTGAARLVLVRELAARLRSDGLTVLAHGCVGGGNDQRRFARYTHLVAPDLGVYAPWVDPAALRRFPDRESMYMAVAEAGLWLDPGSGATHSTDASLIGASHESSALEELTSPVSPDTLAPRWSSWPGQAPEKPETISVTFTAGRLTAVAECAGDPIDLLSRAHVAGAGHGVWLRDVVERRIIGTRCRGVYEAPGLEVLGAAWSRALQVCLDPAAAALYDHLSKVLGTAVYEARYLDPAARAARAALDELTEAVTATVALTLHRGTVTVAAVHTSTGQTDRQTRFGTGGNRWRAPVIPGS